MKTASLNWGVVVVCGWLFILTAAAIGLSPSESGRFDWAVPVLATLILLWLILTGTTVSLYFYRSWRRASLVPNRRAYVAWLAFETACAIGVGGGLLWIALVGHADGIHQMRELQLRHELAVLRAILNQYSADNHKRPQSLAELVERGYLKQVPIDPITGRSDSWILEWSNDANQPGITNIRSGSRSRSSARTRYRDW